MVQQKLIIVQRKFIIVQRNVIVDQHKMQKKRKKNPSALFGTTNRTEVTSTWNIIIKK